MKIITVVGARPNFIKMAPIHQALVAAGHESFMVHTGQHYDAAMSEVFFRDLGMPQPHVNLQVGSGSHAVQTARIMERFEPVLIEQKPQVVLVAGDVNSTLACALVAAKLHVKIAHLEAGVRSYDRSMPEEINRLCVDQISDLLLTPGAEADENLRREGISNDRIARVGNAMIDSLLTHLPAARLRVPVVCERLQVQPGAYGLATLHRPANVDDSATLERIVSALTQVAELLPLVWCTHPRTRAHLEKRTSPLPAALRLIDPLGYLEFLALQSAAKLVLTDSGGVQEETTAMGVPCLTLRDTTEWLETVHAGSNTLVGTQPERIVAAAKQSLRASVKTSAQPPLWDGKTARRVVDALEKHF